MRKRHSPDLKTQIVLEMLKEQKTIAELALEHGMHPTQLHRWRTHVLENPPQLFLRSDNVVAVKAEYEQKIDELYTEIGIAKKSIRLDQGRAPCAARLPRC